VICNTIATLPEEVYSVATFRSKAVAVDVNPGKTVGMEYTRKNPIFNVILMTNTENNRK